MSSPRRLTVLDGMRGVAAAFVFVHHAGPLAAGHELLPRGYLAVDFFFMLSGFVMARTYEPRLAAGLGARGFLTTRVRRLYPVMATGVLLGAAAALTGGGSFAPTMGVLASELLFLPTFGGKDGVFILDGVQWSLLFELFANALHAAFLHRTRVPELVWIALGALLALTVVALWWDGIDLGYSSGNFTGAVPRVLFSYVVGIVLARREWPSSARDTGWRVSPPVLLVAVIVAAGLTPQAWPHWIVDLAVAALAFPALIVLGAQAEASPAAARAMAAAGALSFPFYAVHLPATRLAVTLASATLGTGPALFALCAAVAVATGVGVQSLAKPRRAGPPAAGDQAISRASMPASLVESTPSASAA